MPKHILFLSPAFPRTEDEDYIVTYFINYIKALSEQRSDYKLSIITIGYPKEKARYKCYNIEVYSFGSKKKFSKLVKPLLWREVVTCADSIHRKEPVTAIHALWLKECAYLAPKLAKKWKVKAICTIMGTELRKYNPYLGLIKLKQLELVSVSKNEKEFLEKKLGSKSTFIPWGVPVLPREDGVTTRINDLLFVGFLSDNKNLNLFLSIVQSVKVQRPELKAKIIGADYSGGLWENKIKALKLTANIEFLGLRTNTEVHKEMLQSKIFVHTATFEAQGYAMLEALACGMYVISKKVGIAKATERWTIAEKKDEFVVAINELLNKGLTYEADYDYPIEDTIESYSNLYGQASG